KKALCIRTYVSCMDTQARILLTRNGFDLSSSPPQATFDYPSFTHKFRIDNLANFNSEYFDLSQVPENYSHDLNYNDLIGSIIKLPGASKSESHVQLLEKLFSVQKRLENLSIIGNSNLNSNSLLWVIVKLRRFSFGYEKGLDANNLLCKMAESVPESLESIEIRMGMFRSESLRKFFEGWYRKG
ncbi:5276_t:CDS:2, partial [Diversispora eburnea]